MKANLMDVNWNLQDILMIQQPQVRRMMVQLPKHTSYIQIATPSDTAGYIECLDDTYTILVDIPDYWTDFNGGNGHWMKK
jgi:hypothetical protein